MRLDIQDPKTGRTKIVYDLTTGIYTVEQINSELLTLEKSNKSPLECLCIGNLPDFSAIVEQRIKEHVKQDLPVDYRPDGYMRTQPIPETLKELSGIIKFSEGNIDEVAYNSEQYLNSTGQVYSRHKASVEDNFQPHDKLVIWHTHLSCVPTGSGDVKTFKEVAGLFETLKPESCFDVRYIPKMDKFYWFTLQRKPLLKRLFG